MDATNDDYGFRGFFQLQDPHDLLAKMLHDLARLKANPCDSYAAFDFFVTANHMVHWCWPNARVQQRELRRTESIPRICEHLADGAKHFLLNRPHSGVADIQHVDAPREPTANLPDGLYVSLIDEDSKEFGSATISAVELAHKVFVYWAARIRR